MKYFLTGIGIFATMLIVGGIIENWSYLVTWAAYPTPHLTLSDAVIQIGSMVVLCIIVDCMGWLPE